MKKLILIGVMTVSTLCVSGQIGSIKDKINAKVKGKKANESTASADTDNLNQIEQAGLLKEGHPKIYGTLWRGSRKSGSSSECKDLKYEKKQWQMDLKDIKKENGVVTSFVITRNASMSSGTYTLTPKGIAKDANGNYTDATCWTTGKNYYVVVYNGGLYVVTNDPYPTNDYCIMGAFGSKSANLETLKNYTAPLVERKKASQKAAGEKAKAERDAAHAKYSIKGKEIKSIEVIATHDDKFGIWSKFKFGIAATLQDGTVIKTSNIGGKGYMTDYNVKVSGAISDLMGYQVKPLVTELKGDYITVSVVSKYDSKITIDKKLVLNYKSSVKLYFNGGNGLTGPTAKPGKSIRVEAKAIKHSETGENLVQYNVYNLDGDLINAVRTKPDRNFFISTKGGNGSNGNNANAYNGANGGNITFVTDINLKDYTFDYDTSGGNGGSTNSRSYASGRNGRDGSFTKKIQNLDW